MTGDPRDLRYETWRCRHGTDAEQPAEQTPTVRRHSENEHDRGIDQANALSDDRSAFGCCLDTSIDLADHLKRIARDERSRNRLDIYGAAR